MLRDIYLTQDLFHENNKLYFEHLKKFAYIYMYIKNVHIKEQLASVRLS